jgi:hypothetical protein
MDATVIDAYVRGRLAGANYFHAKHRDERTARPANPYTSSYLATVEWDRGFSDGYAQGQRAPRTRPNDRDRRQAA